MQKKPFESHTLLEPKRALRVYLDALLSEATIDTTEEALLSTSDAVTTKPDEDTSQVVEATTQMSALRSTVSDVPHIEGAQIVRADTEVVPEIASEIAPEIALESVATSKKSAEEPTAYQPDWAENRFQCLSFKVAGITLAAPLEKLHGILELTEPITELPGYAPWALGLLPNRGQNVHVVDIAKIIMPENKQIDTAPAIERVKYLVLIDDGKYGLAADSISQVLTLEPDDVRWRSQKSRRPWLAGTVIDKMCALLEVDSLCLQLQAGLTEPE